MIGSTVAEGSPPVRMSGGSLAWMLEMRTAAPKLAPPLVDVLASAKPSS